MAGEREKERENRNISLPTAGSFLDSTLISGLWGRAVRDRPHARAFARADYANQD